MTTSGTHVVGANFAKRPERLVFFLKQNFRV